jgi:Protein of unknown function (DUF3038)
VAVSDVLESFNPMLSIQMMPASTPKLDDLSLKSKLDSSQLNQITTELDLVMIALAALVKIDRAEMTQIAQDLQLESSLVDWLNEWPIDRATAIEQLDLQQLRAIVLIANHLAQAHQTLVRQTIDDWQQTIQSAQLPLQSPSLATYIGNFITIYQTRFGRKTTHSFEALSAAALNLLIELLFYGSPKGHQRLWGAVLQRSHVLQPKSL